MSSDPSGGAAKTSSKENAKDDLAKNTGLMTTEEREKGNITWRAYTYFLSSGGWIYIFGLVFFAFGGSACSSYANFWLSRWGTEQITDAIMRKPMTKAQNMYYFDYYALLQMMFLVGTFFRTCVMVQHGLDSSRKLHKGLISSVLGTSVAFFDTTPMV